MHHESSMEDEGIKETDEPIAVTRLEVKQEWPSALAMLRLSEPLVSVLSAWCSFAVGRLSCGLHIDHRLSLRPRVESETWVLVSVNERDREHLTSEILG